MIRHDWTRQEIANMYQQPFPDLVFAAARIHRENFNPLEIQRSTLLSIKTGGCPENCKYCPQSAHYKTSVQAEGLMDFEEVLGFARQAKDSGSTRFCMGAAWREVRDGKQFDRVLEIVSGVKELGLEVCCTLGMLSESQARQLKDAGCYAYNHNLDTSPEYYEKIISTRTYQDRLETLLNVRKAGMTVCCGGILGMGESEEDRWGLLQQLANQNPHPESVPVNMLVKVEGTPLSEEKNLDPFSFVRMIATARILMPKSYVRLSAGRSSMTDELQALCFLAGANSIFAGEKLLTTPNPKVNEDMELVDRLGMFFKDSGISDNGSGAKVCYSGLPEAALARGEGFAGRSSIHGSKTSDSIESEI
ncbi:MAG TPA: biotin synthase BioB [Oligoflexia bacterium]|nr:biotin synthase BioB [Oligoflexia bacterium]HMP49705.1 biotin synthase BioB [Oligoflexia bacterium]